ncbi:hypothetical protein PUN28_015513 [Cardiocondyla obscurior]|uniref:Uncharacterized protein n=1 Tax=Cardiocondyla obscurior TaxID=286306 RepID=A0AAW2EXQ9_9HYME
MKTRGAFLASSGSLLRAINFNCLARTDDSLPILSAGTFKLHVEVFFSAPCALSRKRTPQPGVSLSAKVQPFKRHKFRVSGESLEARAREPSQRLEPPSPACRVKSSFSLGTGPVAAGLWKCSRTHGEETPPRRAFPAGPNPALYYCNARSYGRAVSRVWGP